MGRLCLLANFLPKITTQKIQIFFGIFLNDFKMAFNIFSMYLKPARGGMWFKKEVFKTNFIILNTIQAIKFSRKNFVRSLFEK